MEDKELKSLRRLLKSDGYALGTFLDSGATGCVFKAVKVEDRTEVAIKVIEKKKVPKEYYDDDLPLEMEVWESLNHSNIISLLDYGSNSKMTYCVMHFCPEDLEQWITSHAEIDEEEARRWLRQLGSALQHLSKFGISHGDVKAANVLISERNDIKLGDLNSLKSMDQPCVDFTGTPGYISPEINDGVPFDSEKSDVWSYGVTAYELLTCESVPEGTIVFHPTTWKKIPIDARPVLKRMFKIRPSNRPTFNDIINDPWISAMP